MDARVGGEVRTVRDLDRGAGGALTDEEDEQPADGGEAGAVPALEEQADGDAEGKAHVAARAHTVQRLADEHMRARERRKCVRAV